VKKAISFLTHVVPILKEQGEGRGETGQELVKVQDKRTFFRAPLVTLQDWDLFFY
jgi:hypothetical protein